MLEILMNKYIIFIIVYFYLLSNNRKGKTSI